MRRLWPSVVVVLLCLPAVWPYLGGGLPRSNDSLTHLYRAVELDHLVRSGDLFPRWGPDFAHGYGYPIFNYFAYFSHYLIVLFHFTGLSLLWSLRAAYIAAGLGAGLGAHALGRALAGDSTQPGASPAAGGLLTAAAYVYSPYLLYTANVRGGLPEALALAFLPLAMWALRQSLVRPDKSSGPVRSDVIAVLAIAGFIASHVGMAIQYLPLIGLWGLYCILKTAWPGNESLRLNLRNLAALLPGCLRLGSILALGLGLTAFLWLPGVAELGYVQFDAAFARAGLVYTANFSRLADLLAYPALPVYSSVLNPPVIRALSLPALAAALAGLLVLRRFSRAQRADYFFLLAAFLVCAALALDVSKPIWDSIPLLQRSTFPWRFLGPASLFGAALAGLAVGQWRVERGGWRLEAQHWALVVGPLFVIGAAPFMFPPQEPAPEDPGLADLARFEIPPLLVATTTTGEYTPIWVREFPDTREMQQTILEGRQPERLDAPAAAAWEHLVAEPAHDTYHLILPQDETLTYRSLYFPGWQATLDGQPLALTPTDPDGLIALAAPAGDHELDIRFGSTPVRTAAGWVSVLSTLAVGGWLLAAGRRQTAPRPLPAVEDGSGWRFGVGLAALSVGAWLVLSLIAVRSGSPGVQHLLSLDFGGELTLAGYDLAPSALPGQSTITLVWQARHPLGIPYGFNVRLTDDRGLVYSDTDIERPAGWRFYPGTDSWPADQFILDSYILKPLSGTPPGLYHLEVIAYRQADRQALAAQVIGDYDIAAPTNAPLENPLLTSGGAALIGFQGDRADAAPGDPYRLSLRWQARADAPTAGSVALELVDSAGALVYSRTEPLSPAYPPGRWRTGDVLNQEVFFRLPASLPGGAFHWRAAGAEVPAAPALNVHLPDRSFTVPNLAHPQSAVFGESLQLLGWNERLDGQAVTIELAWQAKQEMAESYRVFLHLLDANGNLVSQSDGEPAGWTRPTTGWLAGEVVLDSRSLTAPGPGDYALEVGLVDEAGNRVAEPVRLGHILVP